MFTKREFFFGMAVTLMAGFAVGYSKAREKFVEALVKATGSTEEKENEAA